MLSKQLIHMPSSGGLVTLLQGCQISVFILKMVDYTNSINEFIFIGRNIRKNITVAH